jgi:hypothetical protein
VSDLGFQATLLYPCLLALLCVGAGLLVDRLSGRNLHAMLLPAAGAATLIAVSQLTTYSVFAAQATPYLLALLAAAGFALGWQRVRTFAQRWRRCAWQLSVPVLAFLAALAPVLFAGRPSFSSYGVLTDTARTTPIWTCATPTASTSTPTTTPAIPQAPTPCLGAAPCSLVFL